MSTTAELHYGTKGAGGPRTELAHTLFAVKLKLRRLDESEVIFGNAVRAKMSMDMSALETGTTLEIVPEFPDTDQLKNSQVALEGSWGRLILENGAHFLRALTGVPLFDNFQGNEKAWLLQTAAALLPAPLQSLFSQVIEIPANSVSGSPVKALRRAALLLRTADHVVSTHALADWSLWQQIFAQCQPQNNKKPSTYWYDFPLITKVLVGTRKISYSLVRSLSVGDIVIPEKHFFDTDGAGSFQIGAWHVSVQSNGDKNLEVIDVFSADPEENNDENEFDDDSADHESNEVGSEELDHLHQLPISLSFELGSLSMTLNQLQLLAPGSVLSMQSGANPPNVRVVGNGRLLGKGELVDVNGQLGVQITSWAAQ